MNRRVIGVLGVAALTTALVLGTGTAAFAATVTGTVAGLTYSADSTNVAAGATVTGYTSPGAAAVIIPDSVVIGGTTYAVTAVGDQAFLTDPYVRSVVIGASVVSIGVQAFAGTGITTLTISNSVTTIGMSAFFSDGSLTSLTLGNSVTSIGDLAFYHTDLASLVIPNSVTTIGSDAFSSNQLTSLTLGDSVTNISSHAFYSNPLRSVTFPASVTSIGSSAFDEGNLLTSATFVGAAPPGFSALAFGAGVGLTVYYNLAFDVSQVAGGFTTPTWRGYNSLKQAAVSFNLSGHGSTVLQQNLMIGGAATQPANPTATGFDFTGWYTSPTLTTRFDFADPITTNTTVYAGWTSLALTGVSISPVAAPVGVVAVLLGIALLMIAGRRRSRRVSQ